VLFLRRVPRAATAAWPAVLAALFAATLPNIETIPAPGIARERNTAQRRDHRAEPLSPCAGPPQEAGKLIELAFFHRQIPPRHHRRGWHEHGMRTVAVSFRRCKVREKCNSHHALRDPHRANVPHHGSGNG
jgi:hypothetical protein